MEREREKKIFSTFAQVEIRKPSPACKTITFSSSHAISGLYIWENPKRNFFPLSIFSLLFSNKIFSPQVVCVYVWPNKPLLTRKTIRPAGKNSRETVGNFFFFFLNCPFIGRISPLEKMLAPAGEENKKSRVFPANCLKSLFIFPQRKRLWGHKQSRFFVSGGKRRSGETKIITGKEGGKLLEAIFTQTLGDQEVWN